ncbi:hypothetical protein WMF39_26475 [Sorangium sp. So ce1504]|uniref:hypothetical protein n=1 Tax=Sorangium sp. So ce1504 TaxID=3133337 RepID=UPI003F5DC488
MLARERHVVAAHRSTELSCRSARKCSLVVVVVDGAHFRAWRINDKVEKGGRRNPQSTHLEQKVGELDDA